MENYCHIVAVIVDGQTHAIQLRPAHSAEIGDIVQLETGDYSEVIAAKFCSINGDDYRFIASTLPMQEKYIAVYHRDRKEEPDATPA